MIRGVHVLAVCAIVLGGLSLRATEVYATRYQSLPVLDWVESRTPLAESRDVPAAADLARGLAHTMPLLVIRDERPRLPGFGPPAFVQRTVGGVRDAARVELGSPGLYPPDHVPVTARLDAIVFNRGMRAAGWAELMGYEMDIKDPETGLAQVRVSGPDESDGVWVLAPRTAEGGTATVAGHRGVVGFVLQMRYTRSATTDAAELVDLSARAEQTARQAAADWSRWLAQQL